jgi:hypothetical protein
MTVEALLTEAQVSEILGRGVPTQIASPELGHSSSRWAVSFATGHRTCKPGWTSASGNQLLTKATFAGRPARQRPRHADFR